MSDYRKCEYRQEACPWHRRCHCLKNHRGQGSENMPFCFVLVKRGACPKKYTLTTKGDG